MSHNASTGEVSELVKAAATAGSAPTETVLAETVLAETVLAETVPAATTFVELEGSVEPNGLLGPLGSPLPFVALVVMGIAPDGSERLLVSIGDPLVAANLAAGSVLLLDEVTDLRAADGSLARMILRRQRHNFSGSALVVDDDVVSLATYADVLEELGFEVLTATSAAEALTAASGRELQVALLDVRLPDSNGYELSRRLLTTVRDGPCPVLMMSADPELADHDRLIGAGALGFLQNPMRPSQLAKHLVEVLAPTSAETESFSIIEPVQDRSLETVSLNFFGRPHVVVGGEVTPLRAGQPTVLLATLAAACPAAVSAERLGRFAWSPDVSANAVYTAISRLRQFLENAASQDLITSDASGYSLRLNPRQIDLVQFESTARDLLAMENPERSELAAVLGQWEGAPFLGSGFEVLSRWSKRLVETRSRLVERLATALLEQGEEQECADLCRELLIDEPWRENVWATMIVSLYRGGHTRDALAAFTEARHRLRDELGLDPGPVIAGLEIMILTHDPALLSNDLLQGGLLPG